VDVLFVGEIRDVDVLTDCLTAPESGRLVITQLHQASPEAAVRRVMQLVPEESAVAYRRLLSRHLRAVLSQVLLQRADRPGRVPAYGLLLPDEAMRRAIAEGRDPFAGGGPLPDGCRTMAEDIRSLVDQGIVAPAVADEALGAMSSELWVQS
jgi:twitching motility protein PilT